MNSQTCTSQALPPHGYPVPAILNYTHPLHRGQLPHADGQGTTKHLPEGEELEISIRLGPKGRRIVDARFRALGCPALVAVGSVLTQLLRYRDVRTVAKITGDVVDRQLGGLPAARRYCAYLGAETARRALRQASARRWKAHLQRDANPAVANTGGVH